MSDRRRGRRRATTPLRPSSALRTLSVVAIVLAGMLGGVVPTGTAGAVEGAGTTDGPLPSVGVVGDSIGYQSRSAIVAVRRGQRRPLAHLDVRDAATIDDIRADAVAAATAPNGPDTLVLVLGTTQANVFGPFESAASGRTTCGACCGPPLDTSSASGCSISRSARRVSTSGWTGTRRR